MSKREYLLSVWHDAEFAAPADLDLEAAFAAVAAFNEELQAEGAWVFAGGLTPASSATVVDARGAQAVITDGPFLESKEYLGGFWVVLADDLDAALALAQRASAACRNQIEVRPFQAAPEE